MTPKALLRAALAALALSSAPAMADPLALPGQNAMSAALYGNFWVYSLELLQKCAPTDARCQLQPGNVPSGPYPVQSSPGQIKPALQIMQGGSDGDNYENQTGPLSLPATGDNPFVPPQGTVGTYEFNSTNEPTPNGFTGDRTGTWEVQIGTLVNYLTDPITGKISNLVFLFDNNQEGSGFNQFQFIWATASIRDNAGALVGNQCYSIAENGYAGGCDNPNPIAPTFDSNGFITNAASTNYVAMATDFCVDKVSGVAYNIGTAGVSDGSNNCGVTSGAHPQGGYYVKNNGSQSDAEFAVYQRDLEAFILANYLNNPTYVLSIDIRLSNLNDGPEQAWICDRCTVQNPRDVPEPASIWMLGLGLLSLGALALRRRARI